MKTDEASIGVNKPESAEPAAKARWRFGVGGVLMTVLILAHLPFLIVHIYQLWPKQHYQFLPIVPFGAAALAIRRLKGFRGGDPEYGVQFWFLLIIGLSLFFTSSVIEFSPWLGVLSLIVNLGAAARLTGGADLTRSLRPAFLFLLLMLSVPAQYDVKLLQFLQRATVLGSTNVYEWAGGLCLATGCHRATTAKRNASVCRGRL